MKCVRVRMKSVFLLQLLVYVNSYVVGFALISTPDVSAADTTLIRRTDQIVNKSTICMGKL